MVNYYIIVGVVSMEVEMACKCGGNYGTIDGRLVCVKCGLLAPYQPIAIEKLIAENAKLKETIAKLVKELCHNAHNVK